MTNEDMKELETWQSSPEGELFRAIYDTDNALKVMEAHMRSRNGLQFLRKSEEDIADLTERLQTVLYATRLRTLVAAE